MLLSSVFLKFQQQKPFCVMARGALERMLSATRLDALFESTAVVQYQRELLFSQMVELIGRVVTRVDRSVLKSYEAMKQELMVSDEAVYQKLRGIETRVSQELVRDSFREARAVLEQLKVLEKSWVRGRESKILDGNHLQATQHRIEELRTMWDAPLPGTALVVWDQMTQLVSDVFLTEDGHAQERSLIAEVLETVKKEDLWIADRNFCTLGFLFGIWAKGARFVVRQHGQLKGELLGKPRLKGTTERGEKVYEQQLQLTFEGRTRNVRRITVKLHKPTRDGSTELHILTNLTPREANAMKVADLYQKRWTIETVFLQLKTALQCEINTLGYPKAALFTFCVALLLQNTLSMLMGSLRAAHGAEAVQSVSGDALAYELRNTHEGMLVAIDPEEWHVFSEMTLPQFAQTLLSLAKTVDLGRYQKKPRGPKKPAQKRTAYHNGGHASTHKILTKRPHRKEITKE